MKIIRRIYTYLIVLISLEIVIWGVINLMRTIFRTSFSVPGTDMLSMSLALVLVGVPVFLGHWLWIKKNENIHEEKSSYVRGIFYYSAFLILFIPIAQNLLALINRGLLSIFGVDPIAAFVGGTQSTIDNFIAMAVNGLIGYYLLRLFNRGEDSEIRKHFHEIFRIHDYVWVLYGLFFILIGTQKILHFIVIGQTTALSPSGNEAFINSLALLLIGFPLWAWFWTRRQKIDATVTTMVRLVFLFILSTVGITVTLTTASLFVHPFIRLALADPEIGKNFVTQIAGPLSVGLPVGVLWYYYHRWLNVEIKQKFLSPENRGISRFYAALLAMIGFIATLVGIGLFVSIFASFVFGTKIFSETFRNGFSNSLATLITALPLWLINWHKLDNPSPDWRNENSASVTRRAYLYIAIFGTVIGSMVSAINLANTLLYGFLEQRGTTFGTEILSKSLLTLEFTIFAIYHWQKIKEDNKLIREQEKEFSGDRSVILIGYSSHFTEQVISAVQAKLGEAPIHSMGLAEFETAVLTDQDTVLVSSEQLLQGVVAKEGTDHRIVYLQTPTGFADYSLKVSPRVEATVNAVVDIFQGKFKAEAQGTKPWQIIAYIMAVLFLSEILLALFSVLRESFL